MANVTNSAGVETSYGSYNTPLKNEVIREPKSTWDQDMFLKVLVAQMSNQDPMNPQSDTEFIGQMAQFSSLEQMTKLTSSMQQMQAYNVVGKYVFATYTPTDQSQEVAVEGKVTSTYTKSGITYLTVQSFVYDEKGEKVIDEETGQPKIAEHDIPMADVDQVIDPSVYGDYGDDSLAILTALKELIDLMKAQQGGGNGDGDGDGSGDGDGESQTDANEGV